MDRYVTGTMIRKLRESKKMTQEELAAQGSQQVGNRAGVPGYQPAGAPCGGAGYFGY